MVPKSFLIWFGIMEAIILWTIFTWNRPSKENREKIREFAEEHDISISTAANRIIWIFFNAYENGLREKIREAYEKREQQSYEEWKKEHGISETQTKQIVKPIKKTRNR